jgi:hypothetical protein
VTGVICDDQKTDSGAKANRSEVMKASTLGLYLFLCQYVKSGVDKERSGMPLATAKASSASPSG